MTFIFFFNYSIALLISFSILRIFTPEDPTGAMVFNILIVVIVALICWKWGRYSVRKRGGYIYIYNFPECHKVTTSEVEDLTIIEKHILVNKKDGCQLRYHFLFGPKGGIHASAQPLIIDKIKRL